MKMIATDPTEGNEEQSVASARARERTAAEKLRNISIGAARRTSNGETSQTSTTELSHLSTPPVTIPEAGPSPSSSPVVIGGPDSNASDGPRRSSCYYDVGRDFYDDGYEHSDASLEDRLDFSDLKLTGREKELQALHDVYSHVNRKGVNVDKPIDLKAETSVAMLKGLSGTGKSTLVKQFIDDLIKKSQVTGGPTKPYFLSGKYDELSGGDPFSAIVEAFSGFAQSLLLDLEDEGEVNVAAEVKRIRTSIQETLGEDANVMATMVPCLRDLIVSEGDEVIPDITVSSENAWNRLKYIFQVFSNTISTVKRPVVMFLDDLQWSDSASLELLESLLTDKGLRYFMFIGAYRSNEVKAGDELMTRMEAIGRVQGIQEIELTNLSLEEMNEFIADALKIEEDRERAMSLTEVIHSKSSGNIFFAVQLLEELQRKGILMFSRMTFEWEWNLESSESLDNLVSDDVLVAVTSKITSTPDLLQKALVSMAYTRSTVNMGTIQQLLELDGYLSVGQHDKLEKLLERAVLDGLLTNRMGSDSYSFAHDRIQQAAHEMVPPGRARDEFRLKMGRKLYKIGSSDNSAGKDWLLFAAADHLNATSMQVNAQEEDPLFLTKINLEVGTRAASIAAFEISSKFLGLAMGCLLQRVKNPWENEYETTLKVYEGLVRAELCQGHFEIGRGLATRVLDHAKIPEDRLATQIAVTKSLGREAKHGEAFKLARTAVRELGIYPKGSFSVSFGLIRDLNYIKKFFAKHSDEDILNLPIVNDEYVISKQALLSAFSAQAYFCKETITSLAGNLRQLRTSLKNGLVPTTAPAIMSYVLLSQAMNDKDAVQRLLGLSTKIIELLKAKELEPLHHFIAAYYIHAWNESHDFIQSVYDRGEKTGMECGDFETGLLCALTGVYYKMLNGFYLPDLEWKFSNILDKMKQYKVVSMEKMGVQQHQLVHHLMGVTKRPPNFEELGKFGFTTTDGTENYPVLLGFLARMQLGVYFGEYEFAEKMIDSVSVIWDMDDSWNITHLRTLFSAIVYATLARKNEGKKKKKQTYLKKAKAATKILKSACKLKGMKGYHHLLLAEAQIAAAEKSGSHIPKRYSEAIEAALEKGCIHDAGLGAQLAGEYFVNMSDDSLISAPLRQARNKLVRENLQQARDLYLKWGAKGLVMHLESKYKTYVPPTAGLFDEQSTAGDSNAVTFASMDDEANYGLGSVVLPKSIDGSGDDVSVLTGLTGATGFTGMASRKSTLTMNPHTGVAGFSPILEADDGFSPLDNTGW